MLVPQMSAFKTGPLDTLNKELGFCNEIESMFQDQMTVMNIITTKSSCTSARAELRGGPLDMIQLVIR